jgi:PIN domain nuclease of toxin-antitoxin system
MHRESDEAGREQFYLAPCAAQTSTPTILNLALHHRNRLLLAQSISEGVTIGSNDEIFDAYPVQRLW